MPAPGRALPPPSPSRASAPTRETNRTVHMSYDRLCVAKGMTGQVSVGKRPLPVIDIRNTM